MCIRDRTDIEKFNDVKSKKRSKSSAHVICFECSTKGHFASKWPNKKKDQPTLSGRQQSLSKRRCFGCKEKGHKVNKCSTQTGVENTCQNRIVRFGKPDSSIYKDKSKIVGQLTNGFVSAYNKYMNKTEGTRRKPKNKAKKIKYQSCYICREKGHMSEKCPMNQTLTSNKSHIASTSPKANINTSVSMIIGSSSGNGKSIWMWKLRKVNLLGPNKVWVPKCAWKCS